MTEKEKVTGKAKVKEKARAKGKEREMGMEREMGKVRDPRETAKGMMTRLTYPNGNKTLTGRSCASSAGRKAIPQWTAERKSIGPA